MQPTMQCMEVWGGNQSADRTVRLAGLDAWVYSRPYGQSTGGGDVYYLSSCATGRITRLLVADVSGHGDVVASTAMQLRSLMRRYVNHIDQRRFVASMNRAFVELSDAGCFATAVVMTFLAPTRALSLCVAGHPPPLIYRAAGRTWEVFGEDSNDANVPLGIAEKDDYCEAGLELRSDDLVLCYTDSLIEARRGESGDLLGVAGLLAIVKTLDASRPADLTAALLQAIDQQIPGGLDADDVTVMLFSPNGVGRRWIDRVLAPLRVVLAAVASPFTGRPVPWPELSVANLLGVYRRRQSGR